MHIHPARSMPFADLAAALEDRAARGYVRTARDPEKPSRVLYCYTNAVVIERAWDAVTEIARGVILDHEAQRVVATPFPKFFNFGERAATIPAESFEVFEKLDGSLGVIWHDGARWRVTTKGSFTASQGRWAQAWLDARDTSALTPGHTYCAEIVYRANLIVVRYPFEGLVFLAAWDADGREYSVAALADVAGYLDASMVGVFHFDGFDAMREAVARFDRDREGFVVRFASGLRLKVKGAEYLRVHRLVSRVTPLALWEAMAHGDDLDVIRRDIPEEFWSDFDGIRATLAAQAARIVAATSTAVEATRGEFDKDVGLRLDSFGPDVRPFIFTARRGGDGWERTEKARAGIFRLIRPTANVLTGYVPSERIAVAHAEMDG